MNNQIIECGINFLSFDRVKQLVPPEYLHGYEWFLAHEGETFSCLPMGKHAPHLDVPIKLARQSGIHTPSYSELPSKGAGKERYVLSIHSEGSSANPDSPYPDMDVVRREDGTWTFDYCAHRMGKDSRTSQSYNEDMLNNLRDGVPVAVYVRYPKIGYINYGLAYVERYDPLTDMFTLHGPVSAEKNDVDFCSIVPFDQLTSEEQELFRCADDGDERKKQVAERVVREKQDAFRKALLEAYDGRCAVTGVDVPAVLQAAHIDPYRGRHSQVVTNGVLLRSDFHLLYDSHLLTVMPETNTVVTSKRLQNSFYAQFDGQKINTPRDPELKPNDVRLETHMREYYSIERRYA